MPTSTPADAPLRARLEGTIAPFVEAGAVPGAVAVAGDAHGDSGVLALGLRRLAGEPTDAATRYDLASLSKVVATLPTVLRLASDGALDLDAPLKERLPNAGWFRDPSLGDRSARDLLSHTSGLPAWAPFMGFASERRTVVGHALASELPHRHGEVVYSDLGFIALGALVEAVSGARLDGVARERSFAPLGIEDEVGFRPLGEACPHVPIAPTERCGWRGRLLDGEVHDEAAWIMDGVAGHAGLFGTAAGLAAYARAWLRRDPALGDAALLDAATRRATAPGQPARGLGWLLAPDDDEPGRPDDATEWRAPRGFGHTGFTGTSLWIDPTSGRFCVLLTNRVHPTRHHGGAIGALRTAVHAAVFGSGAAAPDEGGSA
jgi:CubicO group peptidase (beta-lactamase class C family)